MKEVQARYYNGHSSRPAQAILRYDAKDLTYIHIVLSDDETFVWKIKDLEYEKLSSKVELRHLEEKGAYLSIDDKEFDNEIIQFLKRNKGLSYHNRLMNFSAKSLMVISVSLIALVVLGYFYVLPVVAEKSVNVLPLSFDQYLGNTFYNTFVKENTIDKKKTKYLKEFASLIDFGEKRNLQFVVMKSNEVNAFALPNGQIVVYTGILKNMKSYKELAGLLGHEAAHVHNRHSAKMISRNVAGYVLLSAMLSDINGVMAIIADNAHQLHSLSYSRKFEEEADAGGLKILMNNQIDPYGMVELFEHLGEENEIELPKVLSTHPLTKDRKKNMIKLIKSHHYEKKSQSEMEALFKKIVD